MSNSLRFRLTALYLVFFSLLFVLFSVLLYGVLSSSLYARLDETLASEADTAAGLFADEFQELGGKAELAAREVAEDMKIHSDKVAILAGDALLASSAHAPLGSILAGRRATGRRVTAGGNEYRILVTAPLDSVRDELALVRRAILIGLPVVLLLAGIGGYLLATRALRPVAAMASQASRITGSSLDTRIDIGDPAAELRLLVESFNDLLSRLDQSFATMRRFVADASHELRTPISVIRGEADVALSQDRSSAEYRASLDAILDESRRLSTLLDDLLNLARADAGHVKLQTREFYLNELIAECCRKVQPAAAAKQVNVECRCGEDLQYRGDEELLRRLAINLLDNAIRYTPPGGTVTAALEAGEEGVRIRIADTGIGIAPDQAPRVFERFYRTDEARSRAEGGFGLGLSIVKWIAEAHHGAVECASAPGAGSTFTVTLPRA